MIRILRKKCLPIILALTMVMGMLAAVTLPARAAANTVYVDSEAPTDIALSADSVDENVAAGTTVGILSAADPDPGNTFTYALAAGTGSTDNGSFAIMDDRLTITQSPDFEAKSSYSVRIRATDQDGLWVERAFTITIANVNEAPTDIALSANTINENVAANSTVATLSTTDPDAGNSFFYFLVTGDGSVDNICFSIAGSSLRILVSPNFEVKSSYSLRIRAADQDGLWVDKVFTITINDLNEAPTNIALSADSVDENVPANTIVGTLSAADPDAGSTFSYALVAGIGSADNGSFAVVDNRLTITQSPDFEAENSYSIRIRVTDQGGLSFEKPFTITITDQNEAPVITSGEAADFAENGTGAAYTAAGYDPESDAITWSLDGTDAALFLFDSATGEISFITAPDFEAPGDADRDNVYHLTLTAATGEGAGSLSTTKDIALTVTDVNEAPVISTDSTIRVMEGNATVFTAAATDPEGETITWSITGGADRACFTIVAETGAVRFVTTPFFTAPADADADNEYILLITASDGVQTGSKTIAVTVTQQPYFDDTAAVIEVNGERQAAGRISTQCSGDRTVTTITVDHTKLTNILERKGNSAS